MKEPIIPITRLRKTKKQDCIDVSFVEISDSPTRRLLNASNVFGAIAFFAMILAPGAVEGGNYILAVLLVGAVAVCGHLAAKEDGKRK